MEKQIACKILKSENNELILHKGKKINKIDKNLDHEKDRRFE